MIVALDVDVNANAPAMRDLPDLRPRTAVHATVSSMGGRVRTLQKK